MTCSAGCEAEVELKSHWIDIGNKGTKTIKTEIYVCANGHRTEISGPLFVLPIQTWRNRGH